jgi:SP family facilitated glucose transporter-like MFS transporter 3
MAISAILLATGLDGHHQILSSITIITFVAAFALGLGPIPFLLISELVPPDAVPAVSSLALSCSWISNFVVALAFLPVRDALSYVDEQGKVQGEGRVFYLFLVVHVVAMGVLCRKLYRD